MPFVTIDVMAPASREWKDALLTEVRRSVCDALGAGDERIVVRVIETAQGDASLPSCRTPRLTHVRVAMYEGRTAEVKRSFAAVLRERLAENPGIEPSEVIVELHEFDRVDLDVIPGQAVEGS